ncbi:MAG TPA: decaprenyl-phosphate phosphoribosyltransferase [Acidimicrobiales bacterium]|nr:decaprenyl-phosphate phosphoribosyltransferase [Acidimicrobiales bacterium]
MTLGRQAGEDDATVVLRVPPAPARATPAGSEPPPRQAPDRHRFALRSVLVATRPRQWTKNLLVYAAPAAAGVVDRATPLLRATAAAVLFVAVSAAMYLVNDVLDQEADRLHPVKRTRPVASGAISSRAALTVAGALLVTALALGGLLSVRLLAVLAIYAAITVAYSLWLKEVAVVELACVASGFILRAIAGGVAVAVPLSPWFLLVTSFGALFVVAGKRSSEQLVMGDERAVHRATLGDYPAVYLRAVRALAATVTVAAYCLWAFDHSVHASGPRVDSQHLIWFELSIVPFVLAVLVVELAFEQGRGGEPEELALRHRPLQVLGLCWLALLLVGIYT